MRPVSETLAIVNTAESSARREMLELTGAKVLTASRKTAASSGYVLINCLPRRG